MKEDQIMLALIEQVRMNSKFGKYKNESNENKFKIWMTLTKRRILCVIENTPFAIFIVLN